MNANEELSHQPLRPQGGHLPGQHHTLKGYILHASLRKFTRKTILCVSQVAVSSYQVVIISWSAAKTKQLKQILNSEAERAPLVCV